MLVEDPGVMAPDPPGPPSTVFPVPGLHAVMATGTCRSPKGPSAVTLSEHNRVVGHSAGHWSDSIWGLWSWWWQVRVGWATS